MNFGIQGVGMIQPLTLVDLGFKSRKSDVGLSTSYHAKLPVIFFFFLNSEYKKLIEAKSI